MPPPRLGKTGNEVADLDDLIEELKQKRDELRVQMHLASKELQEEWQELEERLEDFYARTQKFAEDAKLRETGEHVGEALKGVGQELKRGYDKIRAAMKD